MQDFVNFFALPSKYELQKRSNKHALIVYSDIVRFFRPCFLLSSWAILNTLHFVSHRAQVARLFPRGPAVRRRRHAALSRPEICIRQLIISIRRLDLFLSPLLLVQTSKVCIGVSQVIRLQICSLVLNFVLLIARFLVQSYNLLCSNSIELV